MGLSGRKVKQRIPADPRNLSWANDANKFGASYLQKFGWDSSAGLGPSGEGRTKHISVYQKLDMLGIGADHKNSQDGTAWKQGREFENLLRRLNESAGNVDTMEEEMKVDGFVRPTSNLDESVQDSEAAQDVESENSKPRKSKKRKHVEGSSRDTDQGKDKEKKRRKKHEDEEEDERELTRKKKKGKKSRRSDIDDVGLPAEDQSPALVASSSNTLNSHPQSEVGLSKTAPVFVPRPHRAHRARHIASKGLASKSATAISEILGIASSSSITTPSLLGSAYSTPINPIATAPTSTSITPSTALKLQELTTSSKSVMDYFREKLAAKSTRATVSADSSAAVTVGSCDDDYDDRPRGGLGTSLCMAMTVVHDGDERPRVGLGASKLTMAVGSLTLESDVQQVEVMVVEEEENTKSIGNEGKEKRRKRDKSSKRKERASEEQEPSAEVSPDSVNTEDGTIGVEEHKPKKEKKGKKHCTDVIGSTSSLRTEPELAETNTSGANIELGSRPEQTRKSKAKRGKREEKEKKS